MPGKKEKLSVKLVQQKPNKTYKIDLEHDYHTSELCKFLRKNKDREVGVVINGKHTKFNSHAGKKRFATGFEQGSRFVLNHAKKLFEEMQSKINDLKAQLKSALNENQSYKDQANEAIGRLRVNDAVKHIRQAAYKDHVSELEEDRALLKSRLEKVEPIIRAIKEAKTEGQLQNAYKLAQKLKV